MMNKEVILALDQSYTRIGYSIYSEPNLLEYGSFAIENYPNKVVKRSFVWGLVKSLVLCYNPTIVVCEQIRLKNSFGINLKAIIALAELSSRISDASYPKEIYTVDSKSWKAKVVGKASASKEDAVGFVKNKFNINVDHDCADAICMSMYPLVKKPILNLYV